MTRQKTLGPVRCSCLKSTGFQVSKQRPVTDLHEPGIYRKKRSAGIWQASAMSENEMDATFGVDKRAHSICVLKPRIDVMHFCMQSICNALVPVMLPWLKQHVVEMMGRFLKEVIIYYVYNSRSAFPPSIPRKNSTEGNNTLCLGKCTMQDILSKHFQSQD